jgi:FkbM family methyltransferase
LATNAEKTAITCALRHPSSNDRTPRTVVELGAHRGEEFQWMRTALCPLRRYIAVEADPRSFEVLAHIPQIEYVNAAIASFDGVTTLHLCDNEAGQAKGSSSIHQPTGHLEYFEWCTFDQQVQVPCIQLDTLCRDIAMIDLLWVDIQGAERDMIAGGTETLKKRTRYIMIEAEEVEMYEGQALKPELLAMLPDFEVIEDFGYNVFLGRRGN